MCTPMHQIIPPAPLPMHRPSDEWSSLPRLPLWALPCRSIDIRNKESVNLRLHRTLRPYASTSSACSHAGRACWCIAPRKCGTGLKNAQNHQETVKTAQIRRENGKRHFWRANSLNRTMSSTVSSRPPRSAI
ncbi:hypothetical protein DFH07DRAFT_1065480 [Mycena maculata]|uniref:Uncharacterized protein n=1 Tax=Mycena maculata TaxID=230809 RepID=A0AAD7MUE9_9AGAR|nr:hypothetical protein DFH07DRAFT_1065480 [Mycena maculata]